MKHKKITSALPILALSSLLISSCAVGDGMWMGSNPPSPVIPSNVMLLDSPPDWPYKVVGYVQSQGVRFVKDVDVLKDLQTQAAKIGAPAVIMDNTFEDFSAMPSGDSLLGQSLKGTAIAPVHLSPSELAKWSAERKPHSPVQPKIKVLGYN